MEYTYKNSASSRACSLTLENDHVRYQCADKEEVIPYAEIKSVRLHRVDDGNFKMILNAVDLPQIEVSNKYYLSSGEVEDRSKHYSTFVRVLHFHLNNKSTSEYKLGLKRSLLFIWISLAAFAACFFTFVGEFFALSAINPFAQAAILTVAIAAAILLVNRKKLMPPYSPLEIPLHFLP